MEDVRLIRSAVILGILVKFVGVPSTRIQQIESESKISANR